MSDKGPIDSDDMADSAARHSPTLLLYDWFKHMTTLSLITLGGLLSILQSGDARIRPSVLVTIIVAIALAGIVGFDGQSRILKAELEGKPLPRMLGALRQTAMTSFGIGVGLFLGLFVETVG